MLTRRDFLQVTAATAALLGGAPFANLAAQQRITQDNLLEFDPVGQVTLLNFTDWEGVISCKPPRVRPSQRHWQSIINLPPVFPGLVSFEVLFIPFRDREPG